MNVMPRQPIFHQRRRSNIYRMFLWVVLILGLIWLTRQVERGTIQRPFMSTPTPTRTVQSFALEGDALFTAGKLDDSITAYQEATRLDPGNAELFSRLARIQTYSSSLRTTDAQRQARLQEALASINRAVELAPDDSTIHAVRAFVLDWNADPALVGDQSALMLNEAEQEALRALQLDPQNVLALAFYAEILVDQRKWSQAEQNIQQAVLRDPSLMDVHRVYAYVLESTMQYNHAIQEYLKAIEITPNLTFLYISVGHNYRRLAFDSDIISQRNELYNLALEYYAKAARLNDQLKIQDPIPYIAIAKTYDQQGQFFIAARNAQKAIEIDPTNPDLYGRLGVIYQRARNYEGAILVLKCAVRGCTPAESCEALGGCAEGEEGAAVAGLPLAASSVDYYNVYGSLLAALSRPQQNYCPEALDVLAEVRAAFPNDPIYMSIVQAGEQICYSLMESLILTPAPVITPTP